MKKIKFNLEELQVQSFETIESHSSKGTVMGNNYPTAGNCWTKENGCESETDDEPNCFSDPCTQACLSDFKECVQTVASPNCYTLGDICP
ncbi:MAG: hypothetical protein ACEPO8_08500 [Rhodothermaceae bacterium]